MTKDKNVAPNLFQRFASETSYVVGSKWAFLGAILIIVAWAASGPLFRYSDTWQLVINTATTVVTFLMVFVIQNTQNRDARAIHLKLDEIIRAIDVARNDMIDIERLSDRELEMLGRKFEHIRQESENRKQIQQGDRSE
ncbi:MAG TPA: low affinity iron permease family protein [Terriglobales bacterium]|nr:low affinity iron permease family protein [Terriglobales bacterium]